MKTDLLFNQSDRTFKLWEYQISHGQLLIRSPKAPATRTSPETSTNLDIVCLGLQYMAIPNILRGLVIEPATTDEIQNLEALIGKSIPPENVKILKSEGKRFPIVASSCSVSENDWDIFDSPFRFRSQFRAKP